MGFGRRKINYYNFTPQVEKAMKISVSHILIGFLFCLSANGFAQSYTSDFPQENDNPDVNTISQKQKSLIKKSEEDLELLWGEDFSNGFNGQGDNGAWTFGLSEGDLWFITTPAEYDPNAALEDASELYGTKIPMLYIDGHIINSPTRDNGVAMLDADRYNSTATVEFPDDGQVTTNPVHAILESPAIDLSGTSYAKLTYYNYSKLCCGFTQNITVEFSTDGGDNWINLHWVDQLLNPITDQNEQIMDFDLSNYLIAASDVSDCRIRFKWNGNYSHYFWMLDDFKIEALGANDLVIGKTYYNNYFEKYSGFLNGGVSALNYYRSLEYTSQPVDYTSTLNLAAEVRNAGSETQTGVKLTVTVTPPDGGTPYVISSNEISVAPGEITVLEISGVTYDDISASPQNGTYTFNYQISQNEEESTPANNTGIPRKAVLTSEIDNGGFSVMSNAGNTYDNVFSDMGQDVIYGTVYNFPTTSLAQPKAITSIETVLLYDPQIAETKVGEPIYFNVRRGPVLRENPDIPATLTSVVFDSDNSLTYEDQDLEHIIEVEDLWSPSDEMPYKWVSLELPSPILIDPNKIYQAEIRIPVSPENIAFLPLSDHQEPYASVRYDFALEDWVWLGNMDNNTSYVAPIRFRTTTDVSGIEKISSDYGMELVQNYPNPFNESTTIQYRSDRTQILSFELLDSSGKLVFSKNLGSAAAEVPYTFELHRNDLASGVYTYILRGTENSISRKLVVE